MRGVFNNNTSSSASYSDEDHCYPASNRNSVVSVDNRLSWYSNTTTSSSRSSNSSVPNNPSRHFSTHPLPPPPPPTYPYSTWATDPLAYNPANFYASASAFHLPIPPPRTSPRSTSLAPGAGKQKPLGSGLGLGRFGKSLTNLLEALPSQSLKKKDKESDSWNRRRGGLQSTDQLVIKNWPPADRRFSSCHFGSGPHFLDSTDQLGHYSFDEEDEEAQLRSLPPPFRRSDAHCRCPSIDGIDFGSSHDFFEDCVSSLADSSSSDERRNTGLQRPRTKSTSRFLEKLDRYKRGLSEVQTVEMECQMETPTTPVSKSSPPVIPPRARSRPASQLIDPSCAPVSRPYSLGVNRKVSSTSTSSVSSLGEPQTPSLTISGSQVMATTPGVVDDNNGSSDFLEVGQADIKAELDASPKPPAIPPKSARRVASNLSLRALAEALPTPPATQPSAPAPPAHSRSSSRELIGSAQYVLETAAPLAASTSSTHRPTLSQSGSFAGPSSEVSGTGLVKSSGVYVSARLAREHERIMEMGKRKKGESGMVLNSDGIWVKDGYKLVDGVEKKLSSSGVYTPPTFPGPSGPRPSHFPSNVYTPTNFAGPNPKPLSPVPNSPHSSTVPSPNSASNVSPVLSSRKSSFGVALSHLANPLSASKDGSAFSMGWRRSSSAAGDSPKSTRSRQISSPVGLGVGAVGEWATSPLSEEFSASPRTRSASRGLEGRQMGDGVVQEGVGLGYPIDLDARFSQYSTTSSVGGDVPGPQAREKNIKGLSLPLSPNMRSVNHGRTLSGASSTLSMVSNGAPGAPTSPAGGLDNRELMSMNDKSKGVKRKPVPQLVTSDSGGIIETGIAV